MCRRHFKEIIKASSLEAALWSLLEGATSQFQSIHSASCWPLHLPGRIGNGPESTKTGAESGQTLQASTSLLPTDHRRDRQTHLLLYGDACAYEQIVNHVTQSPVLGNHGCDFLVGLKKEKGEVSRFI